MKKFLLSLSLVLLCICLVGCSNAQSELADKLEAHLGRLNSTITSVKDIKNEDITFQAATDTSRSTRLKNPVVRENVNYDDQIALLNLERPERSAHEVVLETNNCLFSCKSQICEMIEMLKSLSGKIKNGEMKLDDSQISGVNELLSNLSVNTNRISMSKNETNTEVGKVKTMLKDTNEMTASLNSRFIRLNNCLETRLTYYKNCLNCLNQIRILLTCEDGDCTYQDGNVCIDGKCYDDSVLRKYGENKLDESSSISQSDQKLFEEFKNYLERTRRENEAKNKKLNNDEKRLENDYKTSETADENIATDEPATKQVKVDSSTENDLSNKQNNLSDTENRIDPSFSKDIKDDSFYANKKKQENMNKKPIFSQNDQIERGVEQNVDTNTPNTPQHNDEVDDQEKAQKRRTNIDTFKEPTVKRNIDTFRRPDSKSVPTGIIFEISSNKPFPEKITETNIVIFSENPDKQFVENAHVENSGEKTIA